MEFIKDYPTLGEVKFKLTTDICGRHKNSAEFTPLTLGDGYEVMVSKSTLNSNGDITVAVGEFKVSVYQFDSHSSVRSSVYHSSQQMAIAQVILEDRKIYHESLRLLRGRFFLDSSPEVFATEFMAFDECAVRHIRKLKEHIDFMVEQALLLTKDRRAEEARILELFNIKNKV